VSPYPDPLASDVKISWNGATRDTQERIMPGTDWDRVLDNVRAFVAVRDAHAAAGGNRCRVTFQLTFLRDNVDELADVIRLAARLGVDRVKGHHLWVHFPEVEAQSMRRSAEAIRCWNAAVRDAEAAAAKARLPSGEAVLLENIFPLDGTATGELVPDGRCPFLGQEAWVSAAGRFDPCCAPDAQRRTLGEFGNLLETGLAEIWQGRAYRALAATYRNRALCASCTLRRPSGVA
jgi:MoaA/NifB/PqqE/SkfB family radical SAM enzyme